MWAKNKRSSLKNEKITKSNQAWARGRERWDERKPSSPTINEAPRRPVSRKRIETPASRRYLGTCARDFPGRPAEEGRNDFKPIAIKRPRYHGSQLQDLLLKVPGYVFLLLFRHVFPASLENCPCDLEINTNVQRPSAATEHIFGRSTWGFQRGWEARLGHPPLGAGLLWHPLRCRTEP